MSPVAARPRGEALPSISCVVPAYNEGANLPRLLPELTAALAALTLRWEVIVVDDGSRDDTTIAIRPWLLQPGVRYLALSRNFGKEAALSAGLEHAAGDVVLMLDADGQHPLAMLPAMLAGWRAGADAVCAVRDTRADESLTKRLGTRLFYGIVNAGSPMPIPRDAGDFRLMDRCVVNALLALPERNRFLKGLYAWVGFRTEFIAYTPEQRASGRSSFSFPRLLGLAITGLTAFSTLPLRLWSGLGAAVAVCSIGYGGWIVVDHLLNGNPVPGWPTVVVSLMFFSGVQLLSIGILGEYIGRIFTEVKQRPLYLLRETAGRGLIEAADE
jgi:glycosyltransferase involved in cell wall biosynthesis